MPLYVEQIGNQGLSIWEKALSSQCRGVGSHPYYFFYVTVVIGEMPGDEALLVFLEAKNAGDGVKNAGDRESQDSTALRVAQQTNALMP